MDAKGGGGADRDLGARLYVGWLVVVVERFRLDSNKNSRVYLLFGGGGSAVAEQ